MSHTVPPGIDSAGRTTTDQVDQPTPRARRAAPGSFGRWIAPLSRAVTLLGMVCLVGVLPWIAGRDPAQTILRARSAEQEATQEALTAIRTDLGLGTGPADQLRRWFSEALRGDFGESWISGKPVLPGMISALGVSLTLMAFAMIVALVVAVVIAAPSLRAGLRGAPARTSGAAAAGLTALPEFLLASLLLLLGAVWLGWFPPYGWNGLSYAVLPALALGLPAGGLLGRLLADAIAVSFTESWVATWAVAGFTRTAIGVAVIRRALPGLLPQIGLIMVAITGGAVAVEVVFAIPGLGRATLGAADAQDLPALQTGVLILLVIGVVLGAGAELSRRAVLGRALRSGALPVPRPQFRYRRRQWVIPALTGLLLGVVIAVGIWRDPYTSAWPKLATPSAQLPFGADASGRDLLARVAHGAASTIGIALGVTLVCVVVGLLAGLLPRLSAGPVEVANAAPPIIAGLIIAAVLQPSAAPAALAIALVSWAPLAAHTSALVSEVKTQPHIRILPVLGVGPARVMFTSVLPAVVGPVTRHGLLRLPGIALALAALGFLGLGSQPPAPDWGLLLSEGLAYVERGPWVVIGPMGALVVLSVLAVSLSSLSAPPRQRPSPAAPTAPTDSTDWADRAVSRERHHRRHLHRWPSRRRNLNHC